MLDGRLPIHENSGFLKTRPVFSRIDFPQRCRENQTSTIHGKVVNCLYEFGNIRGARTLVHALKFLVECDLTHVYEYIIKGISK